jgi:hypothetical protein
MSVFAPPPIAALNEFTDENGTVLARYGWGLVLAFEDRDNDGGFTMNDVGIVAPDLVFGASWFDALVYLDAITPEVAAAMFDNPADATVGYHVARMDPCTGLVTILDGNATVVIDTFAPSSDFGAAAPTIGCGEDGAPCEDESSPACQACLSAIAEDCFARTCATEVADLDACGQAAGCPGEDPAVVEACLRAACADEVAAYDSCLGTCLDPSPCYEAPPAP